MQLVLPTSFIDTSDYSSPRKTVLDFMQVNFKLSTPFKAYVVDVIPTDTRLIDD
jgi:hypothetical protein